MGKNAAFEVAEKGSTDSGLGRLVLVLPVELACTEQFQPGQHLLGFRWIQARTLGA